jgi:hypothetical protein
MHRGKSADWKTLHNRFLCYLGIGGRQIGGKMVGPHKAIIISSLQHRRQSLGALLRSMPDIGEIYECEDIQCHDIDLYFHPSIILFDCWLDEKIIIDRIEPMRRQFPEAKCLALIKQNNLMFCQPLVDASLVEGFSVDQFFQTVRNLIKDGKTLFSMTEKR